MNVNTHVETSGRASIRVVNDILRHQDPVALAGSVVTIVETSGRASIRVAKGTFPKLLVRPRRSADRRQNVVTIVETSGRASIRVAKDIFLSRTR